VQALGILQHSPKQMDVVVEVALADAKLVAALIPLTKPEGKDNRAGWQPALLHASRHVVGILHLAAPTRFWPLS
jgi:hypothetical protein